MTLPPLLAQALAAADATAAALIEVAPAPPSLEDHAALPPDGGPFAALAADLGDALNQVLVAGLVGPGVDLAAHLEDLARSAAALGLRQPVGPLTRLAACLRASPEVRAAGRAAIAPAWTALHRLLAWLGLFRRELAVLVVEVGLAGQVDAPRRGAAPPAGYSGVVWPLGAQVSAGHVMIVGVDVGDGSLALLRDPVPDLDPAVPLDQRYLSRLFQAEVSLRQVTEALVLFEDHPAARRGDAWHLGPAFDHVPRLRAVTEAFEPPPLPALNREGPHPGAVAAELRWGPAGASWSSGFGPLPFVESPRLRLNLVKALTRHATLPVTACALPVEGLRLLHLRIEGGPRCFPTLDPTLFTWAPADLWRAAADGPAWLQAAAARFDGAPREVVEQLREAWPASPSVDERWRVAWARWMHGAEPVPAEATALVRAQAEEALALAAVRRLDGRDTWAALWLLDAVGGLAESAMSLQRLFTRRYETMPPAATAHDVCARAMLLWGLSAAAAAEEAADGEPPLDAAAIAGPAIDYLAAWLDGLRPRVGAPAPAPLPSLAGLLALGDVAARLAGRPARGATLRALGLPLEAIAEAAAHALHGWRRRGGDPHRAADALWVIAQADLTTWFVS